MLDVNTLTEQEREALLDALLAARKSQQGTERNSKKKKPKTIDAATFERMMDAQDTRYTAGVKNRAMLALMWDTGIRVGELCHLRAGAIDRERHELHVPEEGKRGARTVVIGARLGTERLYSLLDAWEAVRGDRGAYYFATDRGTLLDDRSVQRMVEVAGNRAHAPLKVTPHMFRHSFATYLLNEACWPVAAVAQQLGHSSPSVTYRSYAHVMTGDLHRAAGH